MLINDPILRKRADDLYWLSIADSDIWYWAGAIAAERGLSVEASEPDVSPMALRERKRRMSLPMSWANGCAR